MLRHLARWWVVMVVLLAAAAAEWLREPAWAPVWIAWGLGATAVAAIQPIAGWRRPTLVTAILALVIAMTVAQRRIVAIEGDWPAERAARVDAASQSLAGDLHAAFLRAEGLAERGARIADLDDAGGALQSLARIVPDGGPESGVVILDSAGVPWAWAGRHRLPPQVVGDSIAARTNGYYVVLETRRHSPKGRTIVASVLIWAHPVVPERDRSLAELFRERTEVGLIAYPPGAAPDSVDVSDYFEPTTAGPRLLFSVQPIPPEQGAAKELSLERGRRAATWLVLLTLAAALTIAVRPSERYALLTMLLWLAVRAPIGDAMDLAALFSPATFFRPILGVLSASAGALALTGVLATMAGVWLWRRRPARRPWTIAIGALLIAITPYLIRALARGITPPSSGVSIGLWLTWQVTLVLSASALLVIAAALFRGSASDTGRRRAVALGVGIALLASVVGLLVWSPRGAWPDWYSFLWTPALLLVTLRAPRWATIIGIAVAAGTSAALVTWGAELQGRLQVAERDVSRLGDELDPLAVALLERFGEQARNAPTPTNATDLYALWHGSDLGRQDYPVHLALWSEAGTSAVELPLDSLDLPAPLLSSLVRGMAPGPAVTVTELVRVPGVHYLLLARLDRTTVLTAAIGPRTELIPRSRLGRLLDHGRRPSALYRLAISPPSPDGESEPQRLRWRREGWSLHAERALTLPGGVRTVHAVLDLRGPVPIVVRGTLVVLLDVAVLALLWWLAELVAGVRFRAPRWQSAARSFRVRLAVTLGGFFIVPAVGFAAWSFARLGDEAERGRDLLMGQTLRSAVPAAGGMLRASGAELDRSLDELSRRIDADLAVYQGGELVATSAPILADLGIVSQLMDPRAYRELALEGELELTGEGRSAGVSERVGYRVIQPGAPAEVAVLATPQLADETGVAVNQLDLALVLLLTTIMGVGAALVSAQVAARTLSRPVAELRRAALALGQGRAVPPSAHHPPLEFEPVFGAFERMAADIRASQSALEQARRRTATVLATVATGVVGLDPAGRVLIANRQAVDLLGVPLPEGAPFVARLGAEWAPLTAAVRRFVSDPQHGDATTEFSFGGRRFTLQLTSLGPDVSGTVLALNDVTDISRAERVLAWGEMAQQVAHEIKNPLTPMRLGMQHLRRVYRDRRDTFAQTLDETADRILSEIDRLDTIARAFSRFAAPTDEAQPQPLDRIDLEATAREVVQLYELAGEGTTVRLVGNGGAWGAARRDEVKEVIVNLLENARNAGAQTITVDVAAGRIAVIDDGVGIPAELLPRIFEPRFSTNTSGSGLGLPIVRRLVESWGGKVEVETDVGRGTTVTVRVAE